MDLSDYSFKPKAIIGVGGFGKIIKAQFKPNCQAIKTKSNFVALKRMTKKQRIDKFIRCELDILKRLRDCKNIVQILGAYETVKSFNLVLPLYSSDLFTRMNQKSLSEIEIMKTFNQIIIGVIQVHNKGIVHRDLSLDNIFIDNNGNAIIGDFGLAISLPKSNKLVTKRCSLLGKYKYMAPEFLNEEEYDCGVDIWALGIILGYMVLLYHPFLKRDSNDEQTIIDAILTRSPKWDKKPQSVIGQELCKKILIKNKSERPSAREIQHLMKQYKWTNTEAPFKGIPEKKGIPAKIEKESPCVSDFYFSNVLGH